MTAVLQNFSFTIGDTVPLLFGPITDPDGTYSDLTGATVRWALATNPIGGAILASKSTNTGGVSISSATIYGDTAYTIEVLLTSQETALFPPSHVPNRYYHELKITDLTGAVSTAATGLVDVFPSIID